MNNKRIINNQSKREKNPRFVSVEKKYTLTPIAGCVYIYKKKYFSTTINTFFFLSFHSEYVSIWNNNIIINKLLQHNIHMYKEKLINVHIFFYYYSLLFQYV